MKKATLIILFCCFAGRFFGQDVQVSTKFDTSKIFIGDQIFFSIKIEKPVGTEISFPVFKDTLYKKIEIVSGPLTDTVDLKNGRNSIIQMYLVTSFYSGLYEVPPVYVEQATESGLKRYYSNYALLEVARVNVAPADTTDVIYDIIKPYRAPLTVGDILPWLLIIAAVSFIIWYVIRLIKNRKKREKGEELPVITEAAHIIAFRELEKLKSELLWQNGEVKLYHTRLTEILRQYLDNRFNITSMELTTEETLDIYRKSVKPEAGIFNTLKSVLVNADLVKFAKLNPLPYDNETSFENAWNFVSVTMAKPEPVEVSSGVTGLNGEEKK